jgi:hypothetical protein
MATATSPKAGDLLTVDDVRRRLNYSHPGSIRRLFQRGVLPGIKLNARVIRFRPEDVERFIQAGAAGGAA